MSKVSVTKDKLDILANAIANKSGEPLTLTLDEMVSAVDGIDTSGITPSGNINITQVGVTDVTNYATATVNEISPLYVDVDVQWNYITRSGQRKWELAPYFQNTGDDGAMVSGYAKYTGTTTTFNAIPTGTTITPTTSSQTVGGAYYMMEGAVTVAGDANLVAGNIKSGTTIFGVTGTYAGGSSKNVQVLQSTSRTNSSSLTKVLGDLTVSKTGTYDIYWSGGRSNTSSSYTWGTRLYVDGSGYGTENTSWTNNCQSNHLTNVSLTQNQKLSVYSRGRGGSYYTFVPMLTIIEK